MEKIEVVELYKPRVRHKKPLRRAKPLTEHRKAVLQRKLVRKLFKKKYGTKTALNRADAIFSAKIRNRDKVCQFPDCQIEAFDKLQCSHYIGRAVFFTRFDEDNCVALCWLHHFKDKMLGWEYQKQREEVQGWDGQYTKFMRRWLGTDKFNALIERSKETIKRTEAIQKVIDANEAVQNLTNSP